MLKVTGWFLADAPRFAFVVHWECAVKLAHTKKVLRIKYFISWNFFVLTKNTFLILSNRYFLDPIHCIIVGLRVALGYYILLAERCRKRPIHYSKVTLIQTWVFKQLRFHLATATTGATVIPLNRRACHRAKWAIHAAITWLRSKHRFAILAFVEKRTCIRRHRFRFLMAAFRAC